MRIHRIFPMRRPFVQAFTLVELLVVIAIIALLAALSIGAFTMANQASARNRTTATLKAIESALERYKEANGEYPEPKTTPAVHGFDTTDTAQMLYQAITGDGSDMIKLSSGTGAASSGQVDANNKQFVINGDFIPAQSPPGSGSWKSKLNSTMVASGRFYLVDGFGHPFQYDRAALAPAAATTINPTFDLWSYSSGTNLVDKSNESASLSIKGDPTKTAIWIKNW